MRKFLIIAAIGLFACNQSTKTEESFGKFGDVDFDLSQAIDIAELPKLLHGKDSIEAIVSGEVTASCQTKGCWMTMNAGEQEMFINFKDYGFLVPKNSASQKAVMKGWAYIDTVSVADQKEYALDAQKSQEEIDAITEPKVELSFTASGVVFQ